MPIQIKKENPDKKQNDKLGFMGKLGIEFNTLNIFPV